MSADQQHRRTVSPGSLRSWRLGLTLRWCAYGVLVLLPNLVTSVIGVWLAPNVGIYGSSDNPIYSLPLGILLNLPYAAIHAIAGYLITLLAELVDRRNSLLARLPLFPIFAGYWIYWAIRHLIVEHQFVGGAWFGVLEGVLMTLLTFVELRRARSIPLRSVKSATTDEPVNS